METISPEIGQAVREVSHAADHSYGPLGARAYSRSVGRFVVGMGGASCLSGSGLRTVGQVCGGSGGLTGGKSGGWILVRQTVGRSVGRCA